MKLIELAQVLEVDIQITKSSHSPRWVASIPRGEIMVDGCLLSALGSGATPAEALVELALALQGTRIAVGAYTPDRSEYLVPDNLEV